MYLPSCANPSPKLYPSCSGPLVWGSSWGLRKREGRGRDPSPHGPMSSIFAGIGRARPDYERGKNQSLAGSAGLCLFPGGHALHPRLRQKASPSPQRVTIGRRWKTLTMSPRVDSPFFSTIVLFKNQLFPWVFDGFLKRRINGKNGEGTPGMSSQNSDG